MSEIMRRSPDAGRGREDDRGVDVRIQVQQAIRDMEKMDAYRNFCRLLDSAGGRLEMVFHVSDSERISLDTMYERYEPFMSYVRLSRPASDAIEAPYTVADVHAAADDMSEAHPEITFTFPKKNERGLLSCSATLKDELDP